LEEVVLLTILMLQAEKKSEEYGVKPSDDLKELNPPRAMQIKCSSLLKLSILLLHKC
jgi:hypothetical protein